MKNTIRTSGIIALVVIMGFSMIACDHESDTPSPRQSSVYLIDISGETEWDYLLFGRDGSSIIYNVNETGRKPTSMVYRPDKESEKGIFMFFQDNGLLDKAVIDDKIYYFGYFGGNYFDMVIETPEEKKREYLYDIKTTVNWNAYYTETPKGRSAGRTTTDEAREALNTVENAMEILSTVDMMVQTIGGGYKKTLLDMSLGPAIELLLDKESREIVEMAMGGPVTAVVKMGINICRSALNMLDFKIQQLGQMEHVWDGTDNDVTDWMLQPEQREPLKRTLPGKVIIYRNETITDALFQPRKDIFVDTYVYANYSSSIFNPGPTEGITFQWKRNGKNIEEQTSRSYRPKEQGFYTVTVSHPDYASISDTIWVTHSLDGVWVDSNCEITVKGSTGILTSFDYNLFYPVWQDAVDKGYVKPDITRWRNIKNTDFLIWSLETLTVQYYVSSPNVAIGTNWRNTTFIMSDDGQSLTISYISGDKESLVDYIRKE
jgi:hypothetical protein